MNDYFSDQKIIDHICGERVNLAALRHDRQYISRLAGNTPDPQIDHPFYHLLPPRRLWSKYRSRFRNSGSNPDLIALKRTVANLRNQEPVPAWANELNQYIGRIRERVFGDQPFTIAPPVITWAKKKGNKYRALCQFNPDDNLILCLFARYLRDVFDGGFSPSSYAFRGSNSQGQMPTHHTAFNSIYEIKHNAPNRDFYVAECDISGFFDTVDHGKALAAFRRAAARENLHMRANAIFESYLACYSFTQNVLAEAGPRLRRQHPQGYFPWPIDALRKHHRDPNSRRIGVPQGGAVSGVIANLILDAADKAVEATGTNFHYYRYCDDMILISPVKKDCKRAFRAYLKKLDELKLPYHKPQKTIIYGRQHWENKSKAPYRWSGREWFGCVPWIQFVGYQIRYDGLVRIRRESIAKQAQKLVKTVGKLKRGLMRASPILATRNQARTSLKAKLVSAGVGRVKGSSNGPKPMCWASGFKALHNKPFVPNSLHFLDAVRSKQIRRFNGMQIEYGTGRNSGVSKRREPKGYSYSYRAQFDNAGGMKLIQNPWRPGTVIEKCQARLLKIARDLYKWMRVIV